MSVEKNRSFSRSAAVAFLVVFAGCGVGSTPVGEEVAPLVPAIEAPEEAAPVRLAPTENISRLRASKATQLTGLQAPRDVVVAHSLAVPDGTQVTFMLGMVGCGIMVVASGTATVTDGAFEIAYDPQSALGMDAVSLYYRVGAEPCDEGNASVYEAFAPLPGVVDLSQAQITYGGCWLFGSP